MICEIAVCLNAVATLSVRLGNDENDKERWRKKERVTLKVRARCENYVPGTLDSSRCGGTCASFVFSSPAYFIRFTEQNVTVAASLWKLYLLTPDGASAPVVSGK